MNMGFLIGLTIPSKCPIGKIDADSFGMESRPKIARLLSLGDRIS